jgi:hypothetical protein
MAELRAHDALAMIEYRDDPPVSLLGDSDAALRRLGRTAELVGCRVTDTIRIAANSDVVARCAPASAVLIELDGEADAKAVGEVLAWLRRDAEAGRRRSMISIPFSLIELALEPTWHPAIDLLCDATEAERALAVARASRPLEATLHDIGREEGSLILQQLTEDVGRIAALLASLTDEEAAALEKAKASEPEGQDEPGLQAEQIRSIIRARRLRDQFFRGGLFADPAWDMLLDLMAARLEGTRVAVSSLCIAAAVPATTALRWIKALTDRGLFVRSADPQDGRRVYIALSDDAARALTAYLRAVQRIAPAAI